MSLIAFTRSEAGREEPPHYGQGQASGLASFPSAASEPVRVKCPPSLGLPQELWGKGSHVMKCGPEPLALSLVVSA